MIENRSICFILGENIISSGPICCCDLTLFEPAYLGVSKYQGGGPQWAKSGGEAVLLQFSDSTKDPMHDFNRLFC